MRLEREAPISQIHFEPMDLLAVNAQAVTLAVIGGTPPIPTIASIPPSTRHVLVSYIPGYNRVRKVVKEVVFSCGVQSGSPTATKVRLAIMGRNGFMYTGGSETGLPTTIINGLSMAQGATWQSGRTTGMGDSTSQMMRFTLDSRGVLEAGTPYWLAIMAELMYTSTDVQWSSNWTWGNWVPWPNSEAPMNTAINGRPLYYDALGAAGIDSESWATYENPSTSNLAAANQNESKTISSSSVDVRSAQRMFYWLGCEVG